MGNPPRQTFNTSGINTRQPCTDPAMAPPALGPAPSPSPEQSRPFAKLGSLPRGDGTSAHAAPATSSLGWSEVAVATPIYVIQPARLQVWGGNCAIFEVSLGSFLITSVASRQLSRPGHTPQRRDRAPCRGSDGRGQRLHGGTVMANSSSGFPARWTRAHRSPKCLRGWVRWLPGEGGGCRVA